MCFPSSTESFSGAGGENQSVRRNASVTSFLPYFATRSQAACWMSIIKCIREHPGNCWLWTYTFADVLPYHYAANVHRNFTLAISHAQRTTSWPQNWGGVKVAEPHDSGHGLHFHWVAYPRLNIRNVLPIAHSVGFGRINVHPEPATEKSATYLSKYLIKGESLPGLKQWSTLGNFEGVTVRDLEMSSPSIDVYRQAFREAISAGKPKGAAFLHAKKIQRQFDCS